MAKRDEQTVEVKIGNRMGFHVRPVQRFAELARIFKSDVAVEMKGRRVPGKSVMNLMGLGGRFGDTLKITACGEDAHQAVEVLRFLAENRFFVEDNIDVSGQPDRHLERLAGLSSCFLSDVQARADGGQADAKNLAALATLGLTPRSEPAFEISGPDAEQAQAVLGNLVSRCFYVESEMIDKSQGAE